MPHHKSRPKPQSAPEAHHHFPSATAVRETVESIVIAFVLAFLFRTFEAEAFVIPTGSMAPTLMGRHKDVFCPKCGCPYRVSASEEVDQNNGALRQDKGTSIEAGTCPMCRYTASLGKDPSYNGDRILVGKLLYDFRRPQRWDVIVFKYPGNAPTNFIKRLVGLPGEVVRIRDGDIWIQGRDDKRPGQEEFSIARKPPEKLLAMLQPVFDNDYMARIAEYGWPARWYSDSPPVDGAAGGWTSEDWTTFSADGTAAGENWLRYHHLTPSYQQWQEAEAQPSAVPRPTPQLITDFTAYDTGRNQRNVFVNPVPDPETLGVNWVGDLAVACTVEVEGQGGELAFELCKGGRRFQCRFDLSTGRATLSISGRDMQHWRPTAPTGLRGKGRHEVLFSNCDNQLRLWVDGDVVPFDAPTTYEDLGNSQPEAADLAPVGVASVGAGVKISRLRVLRDIYYIAMREDPISRRFSTYDHVDFSLGPDRFFVLGDNSAKSKDGRLWGPKYWVGRKLLIGKALFIYWPHSWNKIPYVNIPFPYFPNFSRMELVR